MNKYILYLATALLLLNTSCKDPKDKKEPAEIQESLNSVEEVPEDETSAVEKGKKPEDFLPKGYVIFEKTFGDLNKDDLEDCALIIKGTDKSKFVKDESRGELDRNRRGIIVLLKNNDGYELAVKNYECLSSENEDGGIYYSPELTVEITKGKLFVSYAHGRYGYWSYTFRLQNSDLELIGYDRSNNNGPIVNNDVSINYLTSTMIRNENTNEDADSGEEIFKKTVTKIRKNKLLKLSEIEDFDELRLFEE
ncbi:hypothetical protein [Flavobacterium piscisymbiosum]|uniref:Lipoprotein n=1 Tax=Flavobacterium piscisymbiosum TaxID=2893753 RepID=A0ABS8MA28_9FLAO|nr:hypothetical protein [Flavobacterium sp. F-30]MCC9062350.1 hypothetical protein [Flavobacterium sp. F-30]